MNSGLGMSGMMRPIPEDEFGDRAFFEANPDRALRLRPAFPTEAGLLSRGTYIFHPPLRDGERSERAVLVRRIGDGVRARHAVHLRLPSDLTLEAICATADEARCRVIFDVVIGLRS